MSPLIKKKNKEMTNVLYALMNSAKLYVIIWHSLYFLFERVTTTAVISRYMCLCKANGDKECMLACVRGRPPAAGARTGLNRFVYLTPDCVTGATLKQ